MIPAALALLLALTLPAHAGDTAGPAVQEGPYVEWVHVVDVFGPVDLMGTRALPPGEYCGLTRECGDWYQRQPAPVPLPAPLCLLALAMVLMRALKGKTT